MKETVSILDISLFLIAFILLAGLFLFTAGGCAGVSTEPGKSVNPADIPNAPGENTVEPRFAPNPYTDDVIQLKQKMRGTGHLPNWGMRGAEADGNGANDGSDFSITTNAPTLSTNFAGISYTNWLPPDPNISVGPSHVLVMVNSSLAIYNKTGGAAVLTSTLANWFSNVSPVTDMIFDPKCAYDHWNQRYIMVALAKNETASQSYHLISVSQTNNPTGLWWNWKLDAKKNGSKDTNYWADYPSLGFDSSTTGAIYITTNQFS